jgi:hypothetical protein
MPKTWTQKFNNGKAPHVDVLDTPFLGIPAGKKLLISSPEEVDAYVRAIPYGTTRTVTEMRHTLAERHRADATCPLTSGIFLRIGAELALEHHAAGQPLEAITPFWRIIEPNSPLAKKLSCGPEFITRQRQLEA